MHDLFLEDVIQIFSICILVFFWWESLYGGNVLDVVIFV